MNEDDVEKRLRRVRLAAPSEALDRRMEDLFSDRATFITKPWLLLALGSFCGIAATVLFYSLRPARAVHDRLAVAIVRPSETQPQLIHLLLEPSPRQRPLPAFTVSISTRQIP